MIKWNGIPKRKVTLAQGWCCVQHTLRRINPKQEDVAKEENKIVWEWQIDCVG